MATIYKRSSDGMWCAAHTISTHPRKRKVFVAATREAVEAKLAAADLPAEPQRPPARGRRALMESARALGTHTEDEWIALRLTTPTCRYCGVALDIYNVEKDHKVPVSRGGSDRIDNLQAICWECNAEKHTRDDVEYEYTGPRPRPVTPAPNRRHWYEQLANATASFRAHEASA